MQGENVSSGYSAAKTGRAARHAREKPLTTPPIEQTIKQYNDVNSEHMLQPRREEVHDHRRARRKRAFPINSCSFRAIIEKVGTMLDFNITYYTIGDPVRHP